MQKILIIDDEPLARSLLRSLLEEACPEHQIAGEADGVASGVKAIRELEPDIVFLDIEMNDGSGFDLLDQVEDVSFKLIFTTAHEEFALKAFRYHAIDYLLKPIEVDLLTEALEKIAGQSPASLKSQLASLFDSMKEKKLEKLTINAQEGITYIRLDEIVYLQTTRDYTSFLLTDGSRVLVVKSLQEYEDLLPKDDFFRIHQSYIVRGAQVRKFLRDESCVIMLNGDQLPVAKRRKHELLEWLK
jgi:two-component system LytT family response regulator